MIKKKKSREAQCGISLSTIILLAVPRGNEKKKNQRKKRTEIKITVKTVGQSKSVNVKTEQRAAHTPNKHKVTSLKKGTESDK